VLWWLLDDPRFSAEAREALATAEELLAEGFGLLAITVAHAKA